MTSMSKSSIFFFDSMCGVWYSSRRCWLNAAYAMPARTRISLAWSPVWCCWPPRCRYSRTSWRWCVWCSHMMESVCVEPGPKYCVLRLRDFGPCRLSMISVLPRADWVWGSGSGKGQAMCSQQSWCGWSLDQLVHHVDILQCHQSRSVQGSVTRILLWRHGWREAGAGTAQRLPGSPCASWCYAAFLTHRPMHSRRSRRPSYLLDVCPFSCMRGLAVHTSKSGVHCLKTILCMLWHPSLVDGWRLCQQAI